jgi:DNA mismatch repair protein MSH6
LQGITSTDFIPNDIVLGDAPAGVVDSDGDVATSSQNAACVLLTGPNMGGKSTLLRQACLAVIVAQLVSG